MTSVATNPPDVETKARAGRRSRYRQLHALRSHSIRGGAKTCMTPVVGASVEVAVHASGVTTIRGAQRCGSMAACPVCAENGRRKRAQELTELVRSLKAQGHHVYLVTATASHDRADDLRELHRIIQGAWSAAWSGRAMAANGYLGQCRAWDHTYGSNGWHPHIHAVVAVESSRSELEARAFVEARFDVYAKKLRAGGLSVRRRVRDKVTGQLANVGWDVQLVDDDLEVVSSYVAGDHKVLTGSHRWDVGAEVALSTVKRKGLSPWAILRAAVDGEAHHDFAQLGVGQHQLWAIWREYEEATKGLRMVVLGKALPQLVGLEVVTDEEAVEGADESPVDYVESFTASEWFCIVATGRVWQTLERVEARAALLRTPGLDELDVGT